MSKTRAQVEEPLFEEPLLKVDKAAVIVDVAPLTVRRWIDSGLLPAYRIGGVVRIRPADLRAYIEARRHPAPKASKVAT